MNGIEPMDNTSVSGVATGYRDGEVLRREIILALGLVDLDDQDRRLIAWLSTWGPETVDRFLDLVSKVRRP